MSFKTWRDKKRVEKFAKKNNYFAVAKMNVTFNEGDVTYDVWYLVPQAVIEKSAGGVTSFLLVNGKEMQIATHSQTASILKTTEIRMAVLV